MAVKRDLLYQVDGMMVWIAVGLDIVWGVSVRVGHSIFSSTLVSVLHCKKKTVAIYLKLNIVINIQYSAKPTRRI